MTIVYNQPHVIATKHGTPHGSHILNFPKTIELEQRLAKAEVTIGDLQDNVDLLQQRIAALQAQFDHLMARLGLY